MNSTENPSFSVSISPATKLYHADLSTKIENTFQNIMVETRLSAYPDQSPIPLVGSAEHVLMVAFYEGDNWETSYAQIGILADAFTASDDIAGTNTNKLGILFIDAEGRHDRREEKVVTDAMTRAIVKSQGVPIRALARNMKANGVEYAATINIHSHLIHEIIRNAGLRHIPLATEPVLIDRLAEMRYFTDDVLRELVLGTTDVGGLKEAMTAKKYIDAKYNLDIPVAIIKKQRIPQGNGISTTEQTFAWGDVINKRVLLLDDRSDSADSIKKAVDIYFEQGAKEIVIYITHPVFAKSEYYDTIRSLLRYKDIKYIFTSNTLPMEEKRTSRKAGVAVPYVWENGLTGKRHKKQMEILDVHPFIISAIRTVSESGSIDEAIDIFDKRHELLEMRNPLELFAELTHGELPKNKIIYVYDHGEIRLIPPPPLSSSSST